MSRYDSLEDTSTILGTIDKASELLADGGAIVFSSHPQRRWHSTWPDTMEIIEKGNDEDGDEEYRAIWANVPRRDVMGFFEDVDWGEVGDIAGLSRDEVVRLSNSRETMDRAILVYLMAAALGWESISSDVFEDTMIFSRLDMKERWPYTLRDA
jgi:hypothetical protein